MDTYKRLDWLLLALSELRSPWRLVVVGDGPFTSELRSSGETGLIFAADGLVSFRGRLDEAAKRQCLAEAELLVLPSDRSNEAFGIVQLEAMAAGLPALAFQRSTFWDGLGGPASWLAMVSDSLKICRPCCSAWRIIPNSVEKRI